MPLGDPKPEPKKKDFQSETNGNVLGTKKSGVARSDTQMAEKGSNSGSSRNSRNGSRAESGDSVDSGSSKKESKSEQFLKRTDTTPDVFVDTIDIPNRGSIKDEEMSARVAKAKGEKGKKTRKEGSGLTDGLSVDYVDMKDYGDPSIPGPGRLKRTDTLTIPTREQGKPKAGLWGEDALAYDSEDDGPMKYEKAKTSGRRDDEQGKLEREGIPDPEREGERGAGDA